MELELPDDVVEWLELVAKLRGVTPDRVATEVIRIFREVWMSGYDYGRGFKLPEKINLTLVVHGQGEFVELKEYAAGTKIGNFDNISLFIIGDVIKESKSRIVGRKTINITVPKKYRGMYKNFHVISLSNRRILFSRNIPSTNKLKFDRPTNVREICVCFGEKAVYVFLVS